jgi:hypothetical protein
MVLCALLTVAAWSACFQGVLNAVSICVTKKRFLIEVGIWRKQFTDSSVLESQCLFLYVFEVMYTAHSILIFYPTPGGFRRKQVDKYIHIRRKSERQDISTVCPCQPPRSLPRIGLGSELLPLDWPAPSDHLVLLVIATESLLCMILKPRSSQTALRCEAGWSREELKLTPFFG